MSKYSDRDHPQVEATASAVLRAALDRAVEDGNELKDLWDIFINEIQQHQHAAFVDALIPELKENLKQALKNECESEIREEAIKELREKLREDIEAELRAEIISVHRAKIEAQIYEKLMLELGPHVRDRFVQELKDEIKTNVALELKAELMKDPGFIAQASRELQQRIAGFTVGTY
jgi:hypothetical protein